VLLKVFVTPVFLRRLTGCLREYVYNFNTSGQCIYEGRGLVQVLIQTKTRSFQTSSLLNIGLNIQLQQIKFLRVV